VPKVFAVRPRHLFREPAPEVKRPRPPTVVAEDTETGEKRIKAADAFDCTLCKAHVTEDMRRKMTWKFCTAPHHPDIICPAHTLYCAVCDNPECTECIKLCTICMHDVCHWCGDHQCPTCHATICTACHERETEQGFSMHLCQGPRK
jgi:hypothetical protein